MNIIEQNYNFTSSLSDRRSTLQIILHHAAASVATAATIHQWHLAVRYSGIGYHFVITKDGNIYRGRPESKIGAHALGQNSNSIGICFEGNFEQEQPTAAQIAAGKELIAYLKGKYGNIAVKGHRDVNPTACPGRNFPLSEFSNVASGGSTNPPPPKNKVSIYYAIGSKGEGVRQIQQALIRFGYSVGSAGADGDYGNATKNAVMEFQRRNGLAVDGIVGNTTNNQLLNPNAVRASSPVQPSTPSNGYPGYLVKQGQKGEIVRKIQNRLLQLTYTSVGSADGDFGAKTTNAVKNFQRNRGLSVDGIVGQQTWSVLFG